MLKTNWRNLIPISARALMAVLLLAQAPGAMAARDGNGTSGGGGGVRQNGRHMTFYSAGFYTEFTPTSDVVDIPGLNALVSYLRTFPYVSESRRIQLMDILVPSMDHEYFKVKADYFDAETKARLIAEFGRVTGQPVEQIDLFAVTDTQAKRTYLLPEFYLLNERDQMAILFHEAYWLLNPSTDYQTIVAAETNFQAVMEKPDNMSRVYQLLQYWGDPAEIFNAMVKVDLANGSLHGLITPQGVPLDQVLSTDYLECVKKFNGSYGNCDKLLKIQLFYLTQKYPKSLLLKKFHENVSRIVGRSNSTGFRTRNQGPYELTHCLVIGKDSNCNSGSEISGSGFPLLEKTDKQSFWSGFSHEFHPVDLSQAFIDLNPDQVDFSGSLPVRYESKATGARFEIYLNWIQSEID